MANLLKMALSETIRTLHRRGWSQRRIAGELGVHRETVARHLRLPEPDPKPANAPLGSDPVEDAPKPANAPLGSAEVDDAPAGVDAPAGPDAISPPRGSGRKSGCEPWRELITAKASQGLSAQRIYQDLVA